MPAREIFFTFDTKVKLTKEVVKEIENTFFDELDEDVYEAIVNEFELEKIDKEFLQNLISIMKAFDNVSDDYSTGREGVIMRLVSHFMGEEPTTSVTPLGFKYLYDEWNYEGCGYDDHYYYTFADEKKVIKKYAKEAQAAVDKLKSMGVDVTFSVNTL